jgi:hypothetical protein
MQNRPPDEAACRSHDLLHWTVAVMVEVCVMEPLVAVTVTV